jgi:hypothetical protein
MTSVGWQGVSISKKRGWLAVWPTHRVVVELIERKKWRW